MLLLNNQITDKTLTVTVAGVIDVCVPLTPTPPWSQRKVWWKHPSWKQLLTCAWCVTTGNIWTAAAKRIRFRLCCHRNTRGRVLLSWKLSLGLGVVEAGRGGCPYVNVPTTPFPEHSANRVNSSSPLAHLICCWRQLSPRSPPFLLAPHQRLSRWAILHIFHSVTHWTPSRSHTTLNSWTESRNLCHWIRAHITL